ncbi:MAG: hypothetical protein ACD_34C00648G0005 [uncultured bacterium]|nr:MAG: hypothetical protein ACD_34C00648G0005 [uncultured bacterium]
MSVLNKIAFYQGIRDDIPNQELARELASSKNVDGIKEIAEHLWDKNVNVRSDCLKVLYETGYLSPDLIAPYVFDFLKLLLSKQNRLVWGAMISLSTIAPLKAADLFEKRELICKTISQGSVITQDGGIKTLAQVAAVNQAYLMELNPFLMNFLRTCRISDVPRHAEFIVPCVNDSNQQEFLSILQERLAHMTPSQAKRINKILKMYK